MGIISLSLILICGFAVARGIEKRWELICVEI